MKRTVSASLSTMISLLACARYPSGGTPPIHIPFFFEAAILSRMRSPMTSRSNCAKDNRTLRVKRPIEVVVLNCCVTETKQAPCWDNAPMESFFGTLKTELVHHRDYPDRDTARRDLFAYIEGYYNRRRIHSAIGYITPQQAEAKSAQPSVHFPGGRSAGAISFEPFLVPMLDQHFAQNASGSRP